MYHKDFPINTPIAGIESSLQNGMRLGITAPTAEIDAAKNRMILQCGIALVVLESADYQRYNELLTRFQETVDEFNQYARSDGQISVARGIALYEEETDLTFYGVFKRADEAMYQNKAIMKRQKAEATAADRA